MNRLHFKVTWLYPRENFQYFCIFMVHDDIVIFYPIFSYCNVWMWLCVCRLPVCPLVRLNLWNGWTDFAWKCHRLLAMSSFKEWSWFILTSSTVSEIYPITEFCLYKYIYVICGKKTSILLASTNILSSNWSSVMIWYLDIFTGTRIIPNNVITYVGKKKSTSTLLHSVCLGGIHWKNRVCSSGKLETWCILGLSVDY